MELFPTEFPQGEENVQSNEAEAAAHTPVHGSPQLEHPVADTSVASIPPDSGAATPEHDPPLRGKAATHGLTAEEKKERQKQQNRRAAERSRNKKREEVTALEMTVNNIQEENNRLRARLATLVAVKPEATPSDGDATSVSSSSIDVTTISRLQGELAAAKTTLLERDLELGRLNNPASHVHAGVDETRGTLVTRTAALQEAQSEVRALHAVINELRTEHDNLSRRREVVTRELELRRSLQGSSGETATLPADSARASGVERTLLELRGLVDGIIKTWEQSSMIPGRPDDPNSRSVEATDAER
ncbi:hypothetical protein CspeluHIS016_0901700 [Cutaneotrichosporon spelunceum]|uniref:BZIP domain-containing protein n=1 Tax=Cutaneotrichosporon spelunceum TaxID=1672016 RepID=A0AAD3TZV8_9TREE|nr:hypothetical protein CspeluHIS016_0901700 [Cutaneotrichosporon spelunceum]